MVDSALTHWSTDRRKIAREETGLPFTAHTAFAFDYEPAHALNQMPREIDPGTRLLLDQVRPGVADRCLDLGCGYGPIGLCLAARAPAGSVMLVDRDFVAVDYARANARRNGLDQVEARLSNGFDQLEGMRFDLVASNLPAKVGREMLRILIEDAHAHLEPGGRFVCVIISGLRTAVGRDLASVFGSCVKLKQGARHTVLEARRALG